VLFIVFFLSALILTFSVLAKRLAGKSVPKMTCLLFSVEWDAKLQLNQLIANRIIRFFYWRCPIIEVDLHMAAKWLLLLLLGCIAL